MNVKRTRIRFSDILRYPDYFAFLLRAFIKRQRGLVYPVYGVFLAEIRGKDDRAHAVDHVKRVRSSGSLTEDYHSMMKPDGPFRKKQPHRPHRLRLPSCFHLPGCAVRHARLGWMQSAMREFEGPIRTQCPSQ